MAAPLLLEVKNLVTTFRTQEGSVNAVNDVSFELAAGETLGVVGESGSGKSVTSLSIMRLIADPPGRISGGKIIFHPDTHQQLDLAALPENEMPALRGKSIAMIFQEPMTSLNPVMTCGAQVSESLMLHARLSSEEASAKTLELFREVQLPVPEQMLHRYPHQLSGGQKQRVMIAMAMSCQPRLLIADEPTTALDVTVQKTILELMKSLQVKYGIGIIFITHDLGVIAELADKVAVMYKGKIVEQGTVSSVFSNPAHPYTKSLLACRPPMDRRLRKLPVVSDFMDRDKDGNIIEVDAQVSKALLSDVVTAEERAGRHKVLYAGKKLIEVKNLCTWFPVNQGLLSRSQEYIKAVDDVSFDLYEGETLGLVGESGCGKSTLGRTILRLNKATSGEILFEGKDILKLSETEFRTLRPRMQLIFQDPYSALNPRMTVGEAIAEPMRVHRIFGSEKQIRERVSYLLARVGLDPVKHHNRYPHEFSGGQRQRICIARALGMNPGFIICDESVSALDVSVQAQVLNLLNELKAEFKFTNIFISHDLGVVKFMSDRMIVMQKGKIEEEGDPDLIYADPQSPYTRKLIDSIPHA